MWGEQRGPKGVIDSGVLLYGVEGSTAHTRRPSARPRSSAAQPPSPNTLSHSPERHSLPSLNHSSLSHKADTIQLRRSAALCRPSRPLTVPRMASRASPRSAFQEPRDAQVWRSARSPVRCPPRQRPGLRQSPQVTRLVCNTEVPTQPPVRCASGVAKRSQTQAV